ncbi:MAG: ribonuclease III [Deltaproteobacteria bacterium HGW-Deltaproteobacteria-14]|jgi:ribonuclease-3|nr:MAG: ribonuclease III [Deltaproteobacteria bacterium HGW-Deltaproteobacteria-14]
MSDPAPEQHPVEDLLGYRFTDPALLEEALTHASHKNEVGGDVVDYERLEFLGDAVFELAVSELLFRRLPRAREGRLTQLRARLVNARTLATIARHLGLGDHIRVGRGEEKSGGRSRRSILADVLESIAGAIYLDGGYLAVSVVVARLVEPRLAETLLQDSVKDPKSSLQEWAQHVHQITPAYTLVEVTGPQHDARFVAEVQIGDAIRATGSGASKKDAEQHAATAALREIGARWAGSETA